MWLLVRECVKFVLHYVLLVLLILTTVTLAVACGATRTYCVMRNGSVVMFGDGSPDVRSVEANVLSMSLSFSLLCFGCLLVRSLHFSVFVESFTV